MAQIKLINKNCLLEILKKLILNFFSISSFGTMHLLIKCERVSWLEMIVVCGSVFNKIPQKTALCNKLQTLIFSCYTFIFLLPFSSPVSCNVRPVPLISV